MSEALKLCPFCGGEAASFSEDTGWYNAGENVYRAVAACQECCAGFELFHTGDDLLTDEDDREDGVHCDALEAKAIRMWNRRVNERSGE